MRTLLKGCSAWSFLSVVLLIGIACCRIALTYHVFTQTFDEPLDVTCGMRWLQGSFKDCLEHPPLARVAAALGPYLAGRRLTGLVVRRDEGNAILDSRSGDSHNLMLARLGILPFFIIASAVVWLWTRRLFGEPAAIFAALLFTSLPPVLAHAGLATTDMAVTAFLLCALYAFASWLREGNILFHGVLFGVTVGLAVLSKFSTFLFLPA